MNTHNSIVAGVDGCKIGWVVVYRKADEYKMSVFKHFSEIFKSTKFTIAMVDMPIGLTCSQYIRNSDEVMRSIIFKKSSVFNVPVREAVYCENDAESRSINQEITGKSLSNQSLSIRRKIREIDELGSIFINNHSIIESHPELCFERINNNEQLTYKKQRTNGITERLNLLNNVSPILASKYNDFQSKYRRYQVKRDDIVDAMLLCYLADQYKDENITSIYNEENLDHKGFDCNVYF